MECSCEIDTYDGDGDYVELYNKETRTARGSYKCLECGAVISPGVEHQYVSYKYEGEFWHERTCGDCLSAMEQFYSSGCNYSGMLWNDITVHIDESGGDMPEDCISQLSPIARARVCDMIQKAH